MWKKISGLIYMSVIFIGMWIIKYLIMTPKTVTGIHINQVNEIINVLLIIAAVGICTPVYELFHQRQERNKHEQ